MGSEDRFDVRVAPPIRPLLTAWKRAHRDRPQSAEALTYLAVRSAVERVLASPTHSLDSKHQLRGELAGVRRLKLGPSSRYRLIYITSEKHKKSIILWIGYRKAGDKRDAYTVLTKMLRAGQFDSQFEEVEMQRPG
jgi:hypothetical protein